MDETNSLNKLIENMEAYYLGLDNVKLNPTNKFSICDDVYCADCCFYNFTTGCLFDDPRYISQMIYVFIKAVNGEDWITATFYLEALKEEVKKYND